MGSLFLQCLLDGILLALCGLSLLGRQRGKLDLLLPLIYTGLCLVVRMCFSRNLSPTDFILLPADNLLSVLFLLVPALPLNSSWYRARERTVFWGTMTQFALYLFLRQACLLPLSALGLSDGPAVLYGVRLLSLLLWGMAAGWGLLRWLREQLAEERTAVEAVSTATLAALLLLWQFQVRQGQPWLAAAILLTVVIVLDGGLLLWEQRRIREQQHTRLLEQYLPMVEELVESVRARQHAYRNQMMAVSAAVSTADSLEAARTAVSVLAGEAVLDETDRQLLRVDSKLISGMLYGKIRQAGLRHIQVETSLNGGFLQRSLPESSWVEILGVLLDNALEASQPDDIVYLAAEGQNGALRLTVSNPCPPKSNMELAEMFRRGYSTKAGHGRGYGLYNVRQIVERAGGKLVVRNEDRDGRSYLTIGAIIS